MRYSRLSIVLICILIINLKGFCQTDTSFSKSATKTITETRSLILENLALKNDKKAIELALNLESQFENKPFLSFFPTERICFRFLQYDFKGVAMEIIFKDSIIAFLRKKTILFPKDELAKKLFESLDSNAKKIDSALDASNLDPVISDFNKLFLKFLRADTESQAKVQKILNEESDLFLKKYPNSAFESFIRNYIRFIYVSSKWSFSFEFFSGFGNGTKRIGELYNGHVPLGITFDIGFRKFNLFLRNYIGIGSTKTTQQIENLELKKGSRVIYFIPEASFGYWILDKNRFRLSPFLGIASVDIGPTQADLNENKEFEKFGQSFTMASIFGLNLDIKLGSSGVPIVALNEENFWFLRLRYSITNPRFEKFYPGISGSLHTFTIGFGGFGRKIKRSI